MPAVRDNTWSATTVATGTTLVLPVPAYVVGDLLLAIIVADTGTATWSGSAPPSGSNWAHVTGSPTTNTAQLVCMWKYAVASEPASYTFTASAAESFNGAIVSIRDVHASTPFGATPVVNFTTQASAAKFNMQSITTNVANALVIYASANSGVGVPSLLEGPVFGLVGADGLAESLGIGWGFKASAGATAANVGVSNVAAGAGVKMAIQIAPPAGGAQVIPAYCSADLSTYVDPLNGVTAYNGNAAPAATADTNFGTTLGGLTAADATIAAAPDAGINSFHSTARVTSITGSQNLSGVELVPAAGNRPNVTGKNVLVHVGPSTEGQLQRFSTIASGRGIWFGMRSAAASNYKIWQVYGVELGSLRHQPVVINDAAVNTKASNGTLAPASILGFGFWVAGTGVTTTAWDFASLWVLDTTTICGGSATEPIDIAGIVSAASTGKERKSTVRQGSGQMVIYQPLQIGDGTLATKLLLDSTAIEFPTQYNAATKDVTYNSVDNVAGLTYYAAAGDSIVHTASVVSSKSKYHWRIHASSSASATYDFSGLALIGAGDVQLRAVTTFTGISFTSCPTINTNSALVNDCTFVNSKVLPATLGDLDNITNCSFTKTTGTSHAIEVAGTASTITLTGLTFTGYAGSNGSTGNEAIYVNIATGTVTLNISGGSTPSIRTAGATVNVVAGAATVTLTVTNPLGAPIQDAQVMVAATAGGSLPTNASVTITNSGTTATVAHAAHGLSTGDKVLIKGASHFQNNGVFTITVTGAGTYTYVMGTAPGSNPTGTIVSTFVVLSGLTNASGVISMSRVFPGNQPVSGWARKSSGAPYYKTGLVTGTVNSSSGAELGALLIADE